MGRETKTEPISLVLHSAVVDFSSFLRFLALGSSEVSSSVGRFSSAGRLSPALDGRRQTCCLGLLRKFRVDDAGSRILTCGLLARWVRNRDTSMVVIVLFTLGEV